MEVTVYGHLYSADMMLFQYISLFVNCNHLFHQFSHMCDSIADRDCHKNFSLSRAFFLQEQRTYICSLDEKFAVK